MSNRVKQVFKFLICRALPVLMVWAGVLALSQPLFAPPLAGALEHVHDSPPTEQSVREAVLNPWRVQPVPAAYIDSETLWLARVMFSETKRPEEQELVAWTVRNRVETRYRGSYTYEAAAQAPFQFTALSPGSWTLPYFLGLTTDSEVPGWQRTLALAYYVRHADASLRPFPVTTRHFFSERSLARPDSLPEWSIGQPIVIPQRPIQLDHERFRFYAGIL